jgi:hypothetical protein
MKGPTVDSRVCVTPDLQTTKLLLQNLRKGGYFDFPGKTLFNALTTPPGYRDSLNQPETPRWIYNDCSQV